MQRGLSEVGPSLRRERAARGLTLEEAARDTRIRREFLEALERDEFERLLGDVHVRGCLRTYASYLRLPPDEVVHAYARSQAEDVEGAERAPASVPLQPDAVVGGRRRRDDHRLIGMGAATLLVLAAAFGILSARQPAPPPAELPEEAPALATTDRPITVAVLAELPVEITVVADGAPAETYSLDPGEGRSFDADRSIRIRLSEGRTARITVNGSDEGTPGRPGRPWARTYSYASPSPAP